MLLIVGINRDDRGGGYHEEMNFLRTSNRTRWALAVNLFAAAAVGIYAADAITEITLPGKEVFPESITSLSNGTLIIGSSGQGNILRVMPGTTTAEEFIKAGTAGLSLVLGVLADEKSNTLWVCSNNLDGKGGSPT